MMLTDKIKTFEKLGIFLEQFSSTGGQTEPVMPWLEELNDQFFRPLESIIQNSHIHNPWFTEDNMRLAMGITSRSLNAESLVSWLSCYGKPSPPTKPKTIAVVMAGNIPMVGFHDMLSVMISGHNLLAKLSVKDDEMLKMIAEIISFINSEFNGRISFEDGRLKDFDAVIATGSDNTARYFEYYFGKYPNIIRKNRNSAAILDGSETKRELEGLADDVFRYFGLGCRSVSKIFVPADYDFKALLETFNKYSHIINHNQWANNYEYQRAIHLIDKIPHLDTGFMLIREDTSFSSPISVLNYEKADSPESALKTAVRDNEKLQCLVGKQSLADNIVPFGKAQEPELNDYADNVDTLKFLFNL